MEDRFTPPAFYEGEETTDRVGSTRVCATASSQQCLHSAGIGDSYLGEEWSVSSFDEVLYWEGRNVIGQHEYDFARRF